MDFGSLRALRLFKLFRLIKLVRYSKALSRYQRALKIPNEELTIFFFAAVLLIFFSGAGICLFENPVQPEVFTSIFSSLWWAVATLTTVGYGDIYLTIEWYKGAVLRHRRSVAPFLFPTLYEGNFSLFGYI